MQALEIGTVLGALVWRMALGWVQQRLPLIGAAAVLAPLTCYATFGKVHTRAAGNACAASLARPVAANAAPAQADSVCNVANKAATWSGRSGRDSR